MDAKAEVRMIRLFCKLCVAEGKAEAVETPATHVWVPALYERWVPKWARGKGFISLEEAVAKDARLASLITKHNGRDEAPYLCSKHSFAMKDAKIWNTQLSVIQERRAVAAERKATQAFDSIGSILAGKNAAGAGQSQGDEPEGDDASAQAIAEQEEVQRRLAADARAKAGKPAGKGRKAQAKGSTKGRAKGKLRGEIDEALDGSN